MTIGDSPKHGGGFEGLLVLAATLVLLGSAVVTVIAAGDGIHRLTGWGTIGSGTAAGLSLVFPPLAVALAFYGMIEVWHWHWYWAALFYVWPAAISLLFYFGVGAFVLGGAATRKLRARPHRHTLNSIKDCRSFAAEHGLDALTDQELDEFRSAEPIDAVLRIAGTRAAAAHRLPRP